MPPRASVRVTGRRQDVVAVSLAAADAAAGECSVTPPPPPAAAFRHGSICRRRLSMPWGAARAPAAAGLAFRSPCPDAGPGHAGVCSRRCPGTRRDCPCTKKRRP